MKEAPLFTDRLRDWVRTRPEDVALTFLPNGEAEGDVLTFGKLGGQVAGLAAYLRHAGAAGKPILLMHRPGLAFAAAFCACLDVGAIAVPVPHQARNRSWDRVQAIAANSGAVAVIGDETGYASEVLGLEAIPPQSTSAEQAIWPLPLSAESPAFLQYTSGSTGAPKGVVVTHGALRANLLMLAEGFGVHEKTRMVTWAPMFHDLGLVTLALALYCGFPSVIMPPLAFLQRPIRWLAAISRYRATLSGGPNFAFQACVSRIPGEALGGLDLGSWECAYCGAEPIRAETLDAFAQRFGAYGFRRNVLYPAYGLAEATLMVTGGRAGEGYKVLPHTPPHTHPHRGTAARVSCGPRMGQGSLEIVDPTTCAPVPEGVVGEIWVSGPHVAAGYWKQPQLSAEVFGGTLEGNPARFLRTGDLGLLREGELYIAGRLKDAMIVHGTNVHPEDIEAVVRGSHPGFGDNAAAFSVDGEQGEEIVVVQEVQRDQARSLDLRLAMDVAVRAVVETYGVRPREVVLLRPGCVPCTTSGKVQRSRARELYLSGALRPLEDQSPSPR